MGELDAATYISLTTFKRDAAKCGLQHGILNASGGLRKVLGRIDGEGRVAIRLSIPAAG